MTKILVSILVAFFVSQAGDYAWSQSLHDLIQKNKIDDAKQLLNSEPELVKSRDDSQRTALHIAARFSKPDTVKLLLDAGAEPNVTAYNKFTPLHVCMTPESAKLLIEHGAKTDAVDAWGDTPLQKAAQLDRKKLCDAMIASGAKLDLLSAIYLGKRDDVKKMVAENPDMVKEHVGTSNLWGNNTPLGVAASKGDKELVSLFIENGADVNGGTYRPNVGTYTPICNAVWGKHHEIVELLLKHGAKTDVAGGKFYDSIVDYAEKNSDDRMKQLLMSKPK
jgi:ankyrin repeat protein